MIYAALFTAGVALVAAAAAIVVAVRAHAAAAWAADTLRTQARLRAAEERGQAAVRGRSRHSAPTDTAPAVPAAPAAAERAGETREYRAVPPPGWEQQ